VLQCYSATVLQCYSATVIQCYSATVLAASVVVRALWWSMPVQVCVCISLIVKHSSSLAKVGLTFSLRLQIQVQSPWLYQHQQAGKAPSTLCVCH